MEKGHFKGLLLPQVPIEQEWTIEEFLGFTGEKAGLNPEEWKDLSCKIYKFQAKIFAEDEGIVVEKKIY